MLLSITVNKNIKYRIKKLTGILKFVSCLGFDDNEDEDDEATSLTTSSCCSSNSKLFLGASTPIYTI